MPFMRRHLQPRYVSFWPQAAVRRRAAQRQLSEENLTLAAAANTDPHPKRTFGVRLGAPFYFQVVYDQRPKSISREHGARRL
jgi:hypothetical protein